MQHISTFEKFQTINESWKDSAKKIIAAAGLSMALLTGCNSEQAFIKKLEKENPKKFERFYVKKEDGTYDLKPQYKKLAEKREKTGTKCGSSEADEKRAAATVGQKAHKKGKRKN